LRGACEVFSFHATKLLAIGEGGGVTSRSTVIIEQIEQLKNFGYDDSKRSVILGTNAKLSEIAAAIGVLQLAALPERLARRQGVQRTYEELLSAAGVTFQPLADRSAVPFVSVLFPTATDRDRAITALTDAGIVCRAYYNLLVHRQPLFAGSRIATTLETTEEMSSRILSLPMADGLRRRDIQFIADTVARVLGRSP
jgi:dTDP-4-amino-4,6-dideoxygalactose transaminase